MPRSAHARAICAGQLSHPSNGGVGRCSMEELLAARKVRRLRLEAIEPHPTAEQLFAGAWLACYSAAVGIAAKEKKVALPVNTAVEIEVDLGQGGAEYFLQARLTVIAPGADHAAVTAVAHLADTICPYLKAVRGNIDVVLNVVTA